MLIYIQSVLQWVKSVYSERDGSGSSTRVHIGLILGFIITVGLSFATAVHIHKITIEQFDKFLETAGAFILTTGGPMYGINQVGNWAQKREDNNNTNTNKVQ